MQVKIETSPPMVVDAGALDIARLVASAGGYAVVDVEPFPNKVTIKAWPGPGSEMPHIQITGASMDDVCSQLIARLAPEDARLEATELFGWVLERVTRCTFCARPAFWRLVDRRYPGTPRDWFQCDEHKSEGASDLPGSDLVRRVVAESEKEA